MRILIIEDEPAIREFYRIYFQSKGDLVHEESNGAEGLLTLGQYTFDLVICDIKMPLLDGIGFLKVARLRFPKLPIVVISGGSQYKPEEILNFGASGFFDKIDLDLEAIQKTANNWLYSSD